LSNKDLYRISRQINLERSEQCLLDDALSWRQLLDSGECVSADEIASLYDVSKAVVSKTLKVLDLPDEVLSIVKAHPKIFGIGICYELALITTEPKTIVRSSGSPIKLSMTALAQGNSLHSEKNYKAALPENARNPPTSTELSRLALRWVKSRFGLLERLLSRSPSWTSKNESLIAEKIRNVLEE